MEQKGKRINGTTTKKYVWSAHEDYVIYWFSISAEESPPVVFSFPMVHFSLHHYLSLHHDTNSQEH